MIERNRNNVSSKKSLEKKRLEKNRLEKKRKKEAEEAKSLLQENTELKEKLQAALNKIEELEQRLAKCSCACQIGLLIGET